MSPLSCYLATGGPMQARLLIITAITMIFSYHLAQAQADIPTLHNWDEYELDLPSQEEIEQAELEVLHDFGDNPEDFLRSINEEEVQSTLRNYSHLDPNRIIPPKMLRNAVLFFDRNKSSFRNQNYITIVDFSMRSNLQRNFVVNMQTGAVWALRTTHGAGGDTNHNGFVERLSNTPNSHMSSRGYYRVAEVYHGKYGRSIRLDGLSSTNSNARRRAIVIHGADYVVEENRIPGRSWGCFVYAWSVKDRVVDLINGGSLLYAEKSLEI
jgi:hypothetical protein